MTPNQREEELEAGAAFMEIDAKDINLIRENPEEIRAVFAARQDALLASLSPLPFTLNEDQQYLIFCALVSQQMAPYGPSNTVDLEAMLAAPTLNCGNYGYLAVKLAQKGIPGILERTAFHFIGWDGGVVGNHQMQLIDCPDSPNVLLDASVGLVAFADFLEVVSGKPVPAPLIKMRSPTSDIESLAAKVNRALLDGSFRFSDLLYQCRCSGNLIGGFSFLPAE